jgi:hypothetical protein
MTGELKRRTVYRAGQKIVNATRIPGGVADALHYQKSRPPSGGVLKAFYPAGPTICHPVVL